MWYFDPWNYLSCGISIYRRKLIQLKHLHLQLSLLRYKRTLTLLDNLRHFNRFKANLTWLLSISFQYKLIVTSEFSSVSVQLH